MAPSRPSKQTLPFTDEENEIQKQKPLSQGHTAGKMPNWNSNPNLSGLKSSIFSTAPHKDVICGLLRFPWWVGIGVKTLTRVFQLLLQPLTPSLPGASVGTFTGSHQLHLPLLLDLTDGHSRTPSRGLGHDGPRRMGGPMTRHSLEGQVLGFLVHDQAVFSNWARAFVILHRL